MAYLTIILVLKKWNIDCTVLLVPPSMKMLLSSFSQFHYIHKAVIADILQMFSMQLQLQDVWKDSYKTNGK